MKQAPPVASPPFPFSPWEAISICKNLGIPCVSRAPFATTTQSRPNVCFEPSAFPVCSAMWRLAQTIPSKIDARCLQRPTDYRVAVWTLGVGLLIITLCLVCLLYIHACGPWPPSLLPVSSGPLSLWRHFTHEAAPGKDTTVEILSGLSFCLTTPLPTMSHGLLPDPPNTPSDNETHHGQNEFCLPPPHARPKTSHAARVSPHKALCAQASELALPCSRCRILVLTLRG